MLYANIEGWDGVQVGGRGHMFTYSWFVVGFPGTQLVKNLPALQETTVQYLGGEDPLEKG